MTSLSTGKYGRVDPGPGFGTQYDYTASTLLTVAQDGALVTNLGASAAITLTLPVATAGLEFAVLRIASYQISVTANAADKIRDGATGGSYAINTRVVTVFGCLVAGTWEIVLENPQTSLSLAAFGATGDGTTNDSAALTQLCSVLVDGDAIFIPGGRTYILPDGGFNITKSGITIYSDGMPVLDFNGGDGFLLTGTNQVDVVCRGIHFKDFGNVGFGVPNDGTHNNVIKKRIVVEGCRFTDCSVATGYVQAINLQCRAQGFRISNNHIESLINTGTASNPKVYGIIVGDKCDEIVARTGELQSYGYDGDILNAEDANHITGNVIRKLRNSGTVNSDICMGILSDGWRTIITGNTVEDIQYIGAGDNTGSGVGIFVRGHGCVVTGNTLADCTGGQVWIKDGSTSVTYGDLGHHVIANNTFRSLTALSHSYAVASRIVGLFNGHTSVHDNYFDHCVVGRSGVTAPIIDNTNQYNNNSVRNNTFDVCTCDYVVNAGGSGVEVTGNVVRHPTGTFLGTTTWGFVKYSPTASARTGVNISDNTVIIDEATFAAGSATCHGVVGTIAIAVYGLTIRNNKFLGWGAANPTENWSLIDLTVTADTCESWDISGNQTDAAWRTVLNYNKVVLSGGATVYPTPMRMEWDFIGPVLASAASTITIVPDESGATFANVGAGAAWDYTLPAATLGLLFVFDKVVAQAVTINSAGTDTINGTGTPPSTVTLTNLGSRAVFRCFVAGEWAVTLTDSTVA